jgi:hypothetical protein
VPRDPLLVLGRPGIVLTDAMLLVLTSIVGPEAASPPPGPSLAAVPEPPPRKAGIDLDPAEDRT